MTSLFDKLYDYQRIAVLWGVTRSGVNLFMEQGVGKTYVTAGLLDAWRRVYSQRIYLVIAPLANLETTWVRTISRELPWLTIHRSWEEFRDDRDNHDRILVINYEAITKKLARKIVKREWTAVVYDESQRLKARASRASRAAARFSDVRHRVILSGTPIEQAPQDLWAQFRFSQPELLGRTWSNFDERWLKPTGFMGYKRKFRESLLPRFLALVESNIHRVTKAEVLDLPPLRFVRHQIEMLGDQRRIYDEITRDSVSDVRGREVTCGLAITQLVRQQQITGGFVTVDPDEADFRAVEGTKRRAKGPTYRVGGAKQRRLRRLLERLEPPVVIFCKYDGERAEVASICETRGRTAQISGDDKRHRTATVESFQRGEIDYLVCQIRAGGVGLDLEKACEGVFYSCTFSWIDFDQGVCRLHRNGQTRTVTFHLLQCSNTVDTDIWSALILKKSVTRAVLDRRRLNPRRKKP